MVIAVIVAVVIVPVTQLFEVLSTHGLAISATGAEYSSRSGGTNQRLTKGFSCHLGSLVTRMTNEKTPQFLAPHRTELLLHREISNAEVALTALIAPRRALEISNIKAVTLFDSTTVLSTRVTNHKASWKS